MTMRNLLTGLGFCCLLAAGCGKSASDTTVQPAELGGRGESCQARNDCREGLACIHNTCVQNDFPIQVTAKQCDIIECQTKDDCCQDYMSPSCTTYKEQCDLGDPYYCDQYTNYCTCRMDCQQNSCVNSSACTQNYDCTTGYCSGGKCVDCLTDTDCGSTSHCAAGKCESGCTDNNDCQLLETCQGGVCKETGCSSDRACIGLTGNPLAKCVDTKCQVPCENDGECDEFELCQGGVCVFMGCENDDECRYILSGSFYPGQKAVCR